MKRRPSRALVAALAVIVGTGVTHELDVHNHKPDQREGWIPETAVGLCLGGAVLLYPGARRPAKLEQELARPDASGTPDPSV